MRKKEIKSKEDCEWFGARTIQKPCGQCYKNCQYNDNKTQKDCQKEIEEMQEIISSCYKRSKYIEDNEYYIDTKEASEYLINAGYGKVEDYKKEIVRLKELNDNLKSEKECYKLRLKDSGNRNKKLSLKLGKLKKENKGLRTELSHREEDLIHADEKVFYRECNVAFRENEIKRQAIKEFSEKLRDRLTVEFVACDRLFIREQIDKLLKKYEVNENGQSNNR